MSVMEKGIEPEVLAALSGYLIGEVVQLEAQRDQTGRMVVRVRFFDSEALEWNREVDASDMSAEEKAEERWEDQFVHSYVLSADGSRVVEILDEHGNLVERDPAPWADQEALYQAAKRPRPAEGPRTRPSSLSALSRAEAAKPLPGPESGPEVEPGIDR